MTNSLLPNNLAEGNLSFCQIPLTEHQFTQGKKQHRKKHWNLSFLVSFYMVIYCHFAGYQVDDWQPVEYTLLCMAIFYLNSLASSISHLVINSVRWYVDQSFHERIQHCQFAGHRRFSPRQRVIVLQLNVVFFYHLTS